MFDPCCFKTGLSFTMSHNEAGLEFRTSYSMSHPDGFGVASARTMST